MCAHDGNSYLSIIIYTYYYIFAPLVQGFITWSSWTRGPVDTTQCVHELDNTKFYAFYFMHLNTLSLRKWT